MNQHSAKRVQLLAAAAGVAVTICVIIVSIVWLFPVHDRPSESSRAARFDSAHAEAPTQIDLAQLSDADTLLPMLSRALESSPEFVRLQDRQQDALVSQVASLLYNYGRSAPDLYIATMVKWGATPPSPERVRAIEKAWCASPERFPWIEANLNGLTAVELRRDQSGMIVHDSPGFGVLTRVCYSLFEFTVDRRALVRDSQQIFIQVPMVALNGQEIAVKWRFVWWSSGGRWLPLDMMQQGDGARGLVTGVF